MEYVILDIETTPLKVEHEYIKEYLMDKMISKEKRSFDPNYSKLIMMGLKFLKEPVVILKNEDEKQLLTEFWNIVKNKDKVIFVTHNGYQFDIPFIIIRSVINNVEIPININTNKFKMEDSNHFDTMLFFSQYGTFTNPNLEILGKLHGIVIEGDRVSGSEVEKLYKENKLDEIERKCKRDIEILEKVFVSLCLNYLKSRTKK